MVSDHTAEADEKEFNKGQQPMLSFMIAKANNGVLPLA